MQRTIESALGQTRAVDEIIVVDDASTDGTREALAERFGTSIRYVRLESNHGVSAARNAGIARARGRFIALLDSDDIWAPTKTEIQAGWLEAHPDFGMVLCDVGRMDAAWQPLDTMRRREVIRHDGWVLGSLLRNPALVPSSAMFRREVVEDIGGFDPVLRSAEDLDFHLRVAHRWRIGVVEQVLVEVMRDHDGLSADASTYDDYVLVMERTVRGLRGTVADKVLDRALAETYARNASGMLIMSRTAEAMALAWRALRAAPDIDGYMAVMRFAGFALRRGAARIVRG